jgi:hypothetical protein
MLWMPVLLSNPSRTFNPEKESLVSPRTPLVVLLILSFTFSSLFPVVAQDSLPLDKTFTSDDGLISFQYPADWAISSNDTRTLMLNISVGTTQDALNKDVVSRSSDHFAPGEVRVNLVMMKKADLTSVLNISANASIADVMRGIVKQTGKDTVTFGDISKSTDGDHQSARAAFSAAERGEGFVLLMDYGGDVIGGAAVHAAAGELAQWETTAETIVHSLTYNAAVQPTAQPATEVPAATALDLTETYTSANHAILFNYPSGWIVTSSDDPSAFLDIAVSSSDSASGKNLGTDDVFASREVKVQLLVIDQHMLLSGATGLDVNSTPVDILNALEKDSSPPPGMTMGAVTATSVHDLPGAQFQVEQPAHGDGRLIVIRYRPGLLVLMAVFTASGELPLWDATARAMLESLVVSEDVTQPSATPTAVVTPIS